MTDIWTLVVVTTTGIVSASSFQTEQLCRDAESVARYGQTVAEKIASDDKQRILLKEAAERWSAAHPPRAPKNEEERKFVDAVMKERNKRNDKDAVVTWSSNWNRVTDDGLIIDLPQDGNWWGFASDDRIKFTKCIGPDGATFQVPK